MKRVVVLACFACVFGAQVAGCESALVGATCKSGFELCDGACVNTKRDFRNCGSCGHDCGAFSCEDGGCSDKLRPLADGGVDAAIDIRDAGAPFDPDTGLDGCLVGQRECAGICVDTSSDKTNCGDCGQLCPDDQVCSGGRCSTGCMGGLVQCGDECRVVMEDSEHCGACGQVCASGICEDSVCADAVAGQVVVIGHDYVNANDAMRRIAGNAVFLAQGAPVRVLAYRGRASAESISGVESAIDVAKKEIGREWSQTIADEDNVPLQLGAADVFLVHAQTSATNMALLRLGQRWGAALAQFITRGGIIVMFESPSSINDGTYRILEPARIFGAMRRVEFGVQTLDVRTPGLGVAVRVPARYLSTLHSVHFEDLTTAGTPIVVDSSGRAVVVHRVILPPK